jgi:hypothetical protein
LADEPEDERMGDGPQACGDLVRAGGRDLSRSSRR